MENLHSYRCTAEQNRLYLPYYHDLCSLWRKGTVPPMKGRMKPYLPELTIRDYNIYLQYLRGVRRQLYTEFGWYSCHLLRRALDRVLLRRAYERVVQQNPALERLFGQERDQAVVQMNLNAKNYNLAAEPMSNVYGALYSTLATDDPNQRKSMRYIGSSIGRIFYLMDKAERFEADKCSGRYNVFVVNDLMGQASAVENARRQALAAANDLMRVYSMLDVKLNRSLLDNIMLLGLHHAVEPLEVGAEQENWEIP